MTLILVYFVHGAALMSHSIPFLAEFPIHTIAARDLADRLQIGQSHPFRASWETLFEHHPTLYLQATPSAIGLLERLPEDGLAVVGTRRADPRALQWIDQILCELAPFPRIVLSGLALGIDTRAHYAAMRFGHPTIAILGTPLDRIYPESSLRLRKEILVAGGILMSELAPGSTVYPSHFIDRNRWLAALAKAIWLVQAPRKSGALSTLAHGRKLERDLYVSPAFVNEVEYQGNLQALEQMSVYPQTQILLAARSFATTWLECASLGASKPDFDTSSSDPLLLREIRRQTRLNSGISLDRLLEWSIEQKISLEDFYFQLSGLLKTRQAHDNRGWISANWSNPLENQNQTRLN